MKAPTSDPYTTSSNVVRALDIMCTIVFIIEALLKIIALGFVNTSLEKQNPYMFDLWNLVDFTIILLAILDLANVHYERYNGLMNSFKSLKTYHILKLLKTNDLMVII